MVCPNCRSWVPGENIYCTYCGSAVGVPQRRPSMFLPLMVVLIGVAGAASFYLLH
jgi:hypothetical protein